MSTKTIYYIAFSLVSITMYGQNMFTTTGTEDLVALDYNIYTSLNDVQFLFQPLVGLNGFHTKMAYQQRQ